MNVFLNAAIFGVLAGLATTATTVVIEKFGGIIGGVFGTFPITLILASVGMLVNLVEQHPDPADIDEIHHSFEVSMFSYPIGLLATTMLVLVWQNLPKFLPVKSSDRKALTMLAISIVFWLAVSTALVFALPHLDTVVDRKISGAVSLGIIALTGIISTFSRYIPAPAGKKKATVWVLMARGVFAGVAIFVGVVLAKFGGPTLGGIASVFPAVFLTSMTSVWLAQGEQVAMGATNSLMLGFLSTGVYCFSASFLCFTSLGMVGGVLVASLASIVYNTLLGSFLKWRQNRLDRRYQLVAANSEMLSINLAESQTLHGADSPRVSEEDDGNELP